MDGNETVAATAAAPTNGLRIRPLARTDLAAVVAIDLALSGRSRHGFFARRCVR